MEDLEDLIKELNIEAETKKLLNEVLAEKEYEESLSDEEIMAMWAYFRKVLPNEEVIF